MSTVFKAPLTKWLQTDAAERAHDEYLVSVSAASVSHTLKLRFASLSFSAPAERAISTQATKSQAP